MNIGTVDYVITTFSPAMFDKGVTAHWKSIPLEAARAMVDDYGTSILSRRVCHERVARVHFPDVKKTVGHIKLKPGSSALHVLYSGAPIESDGVIPEGGFIRTYLLEIEEYQEAAA
jgi:hypothetical protein